MSEAAVIENNALDFEYTQLAEIDPSYQVAPMDVYTLEIIKGGSKDFTYSSDSKPGAFSQHKAGDPFRKYEMTLVITDHEQYSGKRVYVSLFAGKRTAIDLQKVMNATGVRQAPGQSLTAWLESFETASPRARFRSLLEVQAGTGGYGDKNVVNFKEVLPAV